MKILKIGGILLNEPGNFSFIEAILKKENKKIVVVISAFSKTTRNIEACAKLALSGFKNDSISLSESIFNFHIDFVKRLITDKSILEHTIAGIMEMKAEFEDILHGIYITKQLTAKTLDKALCFGESLALPVFVQILKSLKFNVTEVPAGSFMVTDDSYGSAKPIVPVATRNIQLLVAPLLAEYDIVVTQGFIGLSVENRPSTMGKESSNLSAAILALALKASELVVWSDVQGVSAADPSIINNPVSIPALSYSSAKNAALNGVKLIYPGMIETLAKANIPVVFKSAYMPDGRFTEVAKAHEAMPAPVIVTCLDGFSIIYSGDADKYILSNIIYKDLPDTAAYVIKITPNSFIAAFPESSAVTLDVLKRAGAKIYSPLSAIYALNCTQSDFLKICSAMELKNYSELLFSANYDRFEMSARFFVAECDKVKIANIIYDTIFPDNNS